MFLLCTVHELVTVSRLVTKNVYIVSVVLVVNLIKYVPTYVFMYCSMLPLGVYYAIQYLIKVYRTHLLLMLHLG